MQLCGLPRDKLVQPAGCRIQSRHGAEQGVEQLVGVRRLERRQLDAGHGLDQLFERWRCVCKRRLIARYHKQQVAFVGPQRQSSEHPERCAVGAVHVVDREHEPLLAARDLEEREQRRADLARALERRKLRE